MLIIERFESRIGLLVLDDEMMMPHPMLQLSLRTVCLLIPTGSILVE